MACLALPTAVTSLHDFSIPKRVSEVLWRALFTGCDVCAIFQSLKGFQRFCGTFLVNASNCSLFFSIPKRVSEVLWLFNGSGMEQKFYFSIPKRVSEVLWLLILCVAV